MITSDGSRPASSHSSYPLQASSTAGLLDDHSWGYQLCITLTRQTPMPVNDKSHGGHESGNTFENIRKHIGMSTESNIT